MTVKDPRQLFVALLSHVREGAERTTKIYEELGQLAERPEVKEALQARVFVSEDILARLDKCFKMIGEQPVKITGRMHETFIEDFRKELAEIQNPIPRALFVLARANALVHLRMAEYIALIEMADITGHYAVGALLETCLADKMALAERTRRLMRHIIKTEVLELVEA